MKVSFKGFNENALTFEALEEIPVGYPVIVSSNHTVAKANADDAFAGICLSSDSENAVVQMSGYVKMNYSSTPPALGRNNLVCAADGTVEENAGGTPCIVLGIDDTETSVEFIF